MNWLKNKDAYMEMFELWNKAILNDNWEEADEWESQIRDDVDALLEHEKVQNIADTLIAHGIAKNRHEAIFKTLDKMYIESIKYAKEHGITLDEFENDLDDDSTNKSTPSNTTGQRR